MEKKSIYDQDEPTGDAKAVILITGSMILAAIAWGLWGICR